MIYEVCQGINSSIYLSYFLFFSFFFKKECNRQEEAKLIELDDQENREKALNELDNDMKEIGLYINEFNRFSELNIDKSKLLSSFMNDKTPLVDVDVDENSPKTDLELALDEFTQTHAKFRKVECRRS